MMRFYKNILFSLFLAFALPVDALSMQAALTTNSGSIQKGDTFQHNYPLESSLFALHHTKERGAVFPERQFEPVPFEDSKERHEGSLAKNTGKKKEDAYLKSSGVLEISLSIKKLIYPFHFHF